jgi:hypothetical protein
MLSTRTTPKSISFQLRLAVNQPLLLILPACLLPHNVSGRAPNSPQCGTLPSPASRIACFCSRPTSPLHGPKRRIGYQLDAISVSPGYLVWSRGLSTSQSAHHSMYIILHHRPLGHQNNHKHTLHIILHLLLPTAYNILEALTFVSRQACGTVTPDLLLPRNNRACQVSPPRISHTYSIPANRSVNCALWRS